eukprot:scaffold1915_cov318-Pavlova_lutheri.AAC.2
MNRSTTRVAPTAANGGEPSIPIAGPHWSSRATTCATNTLNKFSFTKYDAMGPDGCTHDDRYEPRLIVDPHGTKCKAKDAVLQDVLASFQRAKEGED